MTISNKKGKVIDHTPSYELLANPLYCEATQFTPIEFCDTEEEKRVSNFIAKALYLGYGHPDDKKKPINVAEVTNANDSKLESKEDEKFDKDQ